MIERTNCPNCGGPIESEKCKYCGTMFYDFSAIEIDKPCYLKIKHGNMIMTVKAVAKNVECNMSTDTVDAVDAIGCKMLPFVCSNNLDLSMDFHCVPTNNHLMEVRAIDIS